MIGLFDSGRGGELLLASLKIRFPKESFLFFADTNNFPYEKKSPQEIIALSLINGFSLQNRGCTALIIACNTASAYASKILKEALSIPVIEMIEPTVKKALQLTVQKKIGLLATTKTVTSNAYQELFHQLDPTISLQSIACPGLAEHVELNQWNRSILSKYLEPLKEVDTLILGCTHYSCLTQDLKRLLPSSVTLLDSNEALIDSLSFSSNLIDDNPKKEKNSYEKKQLAI
ncbi:glutamate racemase [Chlamydiales bacterium]|nr:glutamate racemase [Chlamydiales bacterium]